MAGDDAEFTLRLVNEVTRPAKQATASIRQVTAALHDVDDFSKMAKRALKDMHREHAFEAGKSARKQLQWQKQLKQNVAQMRLDQSAEVADFAMGGAKAGLVGVALAAAAAAAAVAYLGAKFAMASVESAAFGQKSIKALELLTGSSSVASREFDAVRHEAEGLGLDVRETQKSFQKLLAAQFEIGKAKELIRMGADLQAIGASGEEVSRAMLAITQIKSKGRLQAEEMLQLQEAGISAELVYQALGKRLGKTNAELRKLQEQGKIGSDVGLEAILEAVGKKTGAKTAGDAGRQFATTTLEGMKGVLRGGIQNLFIDIGQAILPTLMPLAEKGMEVFRDLLASPELADLGRKLLSEFEYFAAWVQAEWPMIKDTIGDALKGITGAIWASVEGVAFLTRNWDYIRPVLLGVAVILGLLAIGAITLLAPFYALVIAVMALIGAIASAAEWIWDNAGAIFEALTSGIWSAFVFIATLPTQLFNLGVDLVQGLIGGIQSRVSSAIESIKNLGWSIQNAFRQAMGIASPSKVMAELGLNLSEGLAVGISANDNVVQAATVDTARVSEQAAASAGASGGGRGGNLTLNMGVERQAGGESDEAFAERIGAVVQRKIDGFFEGVALATGT